MKKQQKLRMFKIAVTIVHLSLFAAQVALYGWIVWTFLPLEDCTFSRWYNTEECSTANKAVGGVYTVGVIFIAQLVSAEMIDAWGHWSIRRAEKKEQKNTDD